MIHVKTDDIYNNIAEDVEARFDTFSCKLNRPLPKGKKKKVMGIMKCKLGGKIVKEFVKLGTKTYSYLVDDASEDKIIKETKNCVVKRKVKLEDYKRCLEATRLESKINHLENIILM